MMPKYHLTVSFLGSRSHTRDGEFDDLEIAAAWAQMVANEAGKDAVAWYLMETDNAGLPRIVASASKQEKSGRNVSK